MPRAPKKINDENYIDDLLRFFMKIVKDPKSTAKESTEAAKIAKDLILTRSKIKGDDDGDAHFFHRP